MVELETDALAMSGSVLVQGTMSGVESADAFSATWEVTGVTPAIDRTVRLSVGDREQAVQ